MKKLTRREQIIWASSYIDGEGYMEYKKIPKANGRGKVYNSTVIKIEVCGTDFTPIRRLKEIFGGVIYNRKPRLTAKGNWSKPQEMWTLYHKNVYKVCKEILPFLTTSKRIDKAERIINYYE
jgi:hypothetical protein